MPAVSLPKNPLVLTAWPKTMPRLPTIFFPGISGVIERYILAGGGGGG